VTQSELVLLIIHCLVQEMILIIQRYHLIIEFNRLPVQILGLLSYFLKFLVVIQ
jgi:hypothetical protein